MADEQYTRCPGCKTIFRVTDGQLSLRGGQVRCGHCRTVFNGREELISLAPPPNDETPEPDELAQGPQTVTLRSARALDPPPHEAPATTVPDYDNRFSWEARKRPSRLGKALGLIAIPLLALGLLLQSAFHFRDALAAHVPSTKPALTRLCGMAGCTIRPMRDVAALSIDASDLQADPAHRGLLILAATIRNRAHYAISYPYLQLTLTDAADQIVVRRVLSPSDYVSGTTNTAAGIAPNGEVPVKLFIDASATTQAGYRLFLFFP